MSEEEHKEELTGSGVIKAVVLSIFGILVAIALLAGLGTQLAPSLSSDGASGADGRIQPLADATPVASAPAAAPAPTPVAAPAPTPAASAAPAAAAVVVDGKAVFGSVCTGCHSSGVLGAPKFGDKASWAPHVAKGTATLYAHALSGFNQMPARGNNPALSDAQVKAAVDYMLQAVK